MTTYEIETLDGQRVVTTDSEVVAAVYANMGWHVTYVPPAPAREEPITLWQTIVRFFIRHIL